MGRAGYRYARNNKSEPSRATTPVRGSGASPGINPARVARLMVKRARLMHRHSPTCARNHPSRYYILLQNGIDAEQQCRAAMPTNIRIHTHTQTRAFSLSCACKCSRKMRIILHASFTRARRALRQQMRLFESIVVCYS